MSGATALEEQITALIRDALQVDVPSPASDLIDSGLLDSLALVSLISEIEVEFGFQLPLDDFDVESFRSVERVAAYVARHRPDVSEGSVA